MRSASTARAPGETVTRMWPRSKPSCSRFASTSGTPAPISAPTMPPAAAPMPTPAIAVPPATPSALAKRPPATTGPMPGSAGRRPRAAARSTRRASPPPTAPTPAPLPAAAPASSRSWPWASRSRRTRPMSLPLKLAAFKSWIAFSASAWVAKSAPMTSPGRLPAGEGEGRGFMLGRVAGCGMKGFVRPPQNGSCQSRRRSRQNRPGRAAFPSRRATRFSP